MTTPQLARIDEHLRKLRLYKLRERLEALLQEASTQECSYADFLDRAGSGCDRPRHHMGIGQFS
ncbi:MAG TPA: hypothetical protein VJN62_16465 [Gemmatimonadales bacterium]|nr:hypothetical protein [Gemmatimonadales bacterium]